MSACAACRRASSALVISANPVLTAVLAALFLDERMTWRKASGLLLGIGGVAFVVESRLAGGADHFIGIALHDRGAGFAGRRHDPVQEVRAEGRPLDRQRRAEPVGRACAAAVCVRVRKRRRHRADVALLAALAYLVAARLGVRLPALVPPAQVSGATAASSYHFLMPPLGMLFGWLLLGEHVAPPISSASCRSRSASISSRGLRLPRNDNSGGALPLPVYGERVGVRGYNSIESCTPSPDTPSLTLRHVDPPRKRGEVKSGVSGESEVSRRAGYSRPCRPRPTSSPRRARRPRIRRACSRSDRRPRRQADP